jgi:hypothetical protein
MLQIIKECLEQALGQKVLLTQAASIKFLSMLVPETDREVYLVADFSVAADVIVANASLSAHHQHFIKLSNARYSSK